MQLIGTLNWEMILLNDYMNSKKRIIKDAKNALDYIRKIYPRKKLNENKMWFFGGFKPKGDGYITCYYCGRQLTNTESRILGCGPICHEKYGDVPGRSTDTEIIYQEYLKRVPTGKKAMSFKQYFSVRGGN